METLPEEESPAGEGAPTPAEGAPAGAGDGTAGAEDDAPAAPPPRRSLRARRAAAHDAAKEEPDAKQAKLEKPGKAEKRRPALDVPAELHYSAEAPLKGALRALFDGRPEDATVTVDVRVPGASLLPATGRPQAPQLFGTDRYLDESDLVAVLMHCGYYSSSIPAPPPFLKEVVATLRVTKQAPAGGEGPSFASSTRNNVRSSSWGGGGEGTVFEVLKCVAHGVAGAEAELRPNTEGSTVFSTLIPAVTERLVNTRSSAVGNSKKQRFQKEVTLTYNLCNEPWHKYSVAQISDRGLEQHHWTSV